MIPYGQNPSLVAVTTQGPRPRLEDVRESVFEVGRRSVGVFGEAAARAKSMRYQAMATAWAAYGDAQKAQEYRDLAAAELAKARPRATPAQIEQSLAPTPTVSPTLTDAAVFSAATAQAAPAGWQKWDLRVRKQPPWFGQPHLYDVRPVPGSYFAWFRKRPAAGAPVTSADFAKLYAQAAQYSCEVPAGLPFAKARAQVDKCIAEAKKAAAAPKPKKRRARPRGPRIRQLPGASTAPQRVRIVGNIFVNIPTVYETAGWW